MSTASWTDAAALTQPNSIFFADLHGIGAARRPIVTRLVGSRARNYASSPLCFHFLLRSRWTSMPRRSARAKDMCPVSAALSPHRPFRSLLFAFSGTPSACLLSRDICLVCPKSEQQPHFGPIPWDLRSSPQFRTCLDFQLSQVMTCARQESLVLLQSECRMCACLSFDL